MISLLIVKTHVPKKGVSLCIKLGKDSNDIGMYAFQ